MPVAGADPHNAVVGPHVPPPYEPKPTPCGFFGIGSFHYDLSAPESGHPTGPYLKDTFITGDPAVEVVNNTACSAGKVQFNIQHYGCNAVHWCTWNTKKASDWIMLPKSGRIEQHFDVPCEHGRWRVTAKVDHVEISVEDTGVARNPYSPKLENIDDSEQSDEINAGC